jgi:hypothetical protein
MEDNIKLDLREWGGMDWIYLDLFGDKWEVLVNMVVNLRVPENVNNGLLYTRINVSLY